MDVRSRLISLRAELGEPAGVAIGSNEAVITFASGTLATAHGKTTFPQGTVRYVGSGSFDAPLKARIVGGTGAFANARGTVVVGVGAAPILAYAFTT